MRIITVNLPQAYLRAIDKLCGNGRGHKSDLPDGLYPSRSELIRVAVREMLLREIKEGQDFAKYTQHQKVIGLVEQREKLEAQFRDLQVKEQAAEDKVDVVKVGETTYRIVKRA